MASSPPGILGVRRLGQRSVAGRMRQVAAAGVSRLRQGDPMREHRTSAARLAGLAAVLLGATAYGQAANDPCHVVGTYDASHPHWGDSVIIQADGTYHRGNGDPGKWSFDGKTLTLHWTQWGPEPVVMQAPGRFASAGGFTLTRRSEDL